MPAIDLSILNQRQTPAFYADVFANRPAAGFVGRIFVSTNTFAFYRDNGTGWDLIGGPGTGTVTGSGAAGQVAFWSGSSLISGENNLWWDSTNNHFGINTNTPGTAADIHHDQSTILQLNQTTATNDTRIAFQNSGTSLWRIGNFYNSGANDLGIFDVVGNIQPVTVKKTSGQVLIGTSTVGSGKLVVASATGDNGIQIVGASAPSLRIDNAESGPTKRAGFGISTAINNFIQGSADRDFCMFNGSTTASPILFGVYDAGAGNVQEAARISAARNFLVGTTTDGGQKLQISGGARATGYYLDGMTAGSGALYYSVATNRVTLANYNASGILTFETNGGNTALTLNSNLSATFNGEGIVISNAGTPNLQLRKSGVTDWGNIQYDGSKVTIGTFAGGQTLNISTTGFVGINKSSPTILLDLAGYGTSPVLLNLANPNPNCDITMQSSFSGYVTRLRQGSDDFQVYVNNSASPNLKIAATGNLLVGTATDYGQTLTVAGNTFIRSGNPSLIINKIAGASSSVNIRLQRNDSTKGSFGLSVGDEIGVFDNSDVLIGYFTNATGVYVPVSDINRKKDFEISNLGLNEILNLKPTLYRMKEENNTDKHLGFIAQEVKEFIPQAYKESGDFIGLDFNPIIATLVKAIQELNTKIENLKN